MARVSRLSRLWRTNSSAATCIHLSGQQWLRPARTGAHGRLHPKARGPHGAPSRQARGAPRKPDGPDSDPVRARACVSWGNATPFCKHQSPSEALGQCAHAFARHVPPVLRGAPCCPAPGARADKTGQKVFQEIKKKTKKQKKPTHFQKKNPNQKKPKNLHNTCNLDSVFTNDRRLLVYNNFFCFFGTRVCFFEKELCFLGFLVFFDFLTNFRPRVFLKGCDQDPGPGPVQRADRRGVTFKGPLGGPGPGLIEVAGGSLSKVPWVGPARASLKGSARDATRIRGQGRPRGPIAGGSLSKVPWAGPARVSLKGSERDATRIRARAGPEGRSQGGHFQRSFGWAAAWPDCQCYVAVAPVRPSKIPKQAIRAPQTNKQRWNKQNQT